MVCPELHTNTIKCAQPVEINFIIEEESSEPSSNTAFHSMQEVKELKMKKFFCPFEIISKLET